MKGIDERGTSRRSEGYAVRGSGVPRTRYASVRPGEVKRQSHPQRRSRPVGAPPQRPISRANDPFATRSPAPRRSAPRRMGSVQRPQSRPNIERQNAVARYLGWSVPVILIVCVIVLISRMASLSGIWSDINDLKKNNHQLEASIQDLELRLTGARNMTTVCKAAGDMGMTALTEESIEQLGSYGDSFEALARGTDPFRYE